MNSKLRFSVGIGCLVSTLGIVASSLILASPAQSGPFSRPPKPRVIISPWVIQEPVFNHVYYADQYPDLRRAFNYDAGRLQEHWVTYGINECRRSSPVFDVRYYLNSYPDLQRAFGRENCREAVSHWYNGGIPEGRQGHPDFSAKCYLNRYPDLQRAYGASNYAAAMGHYIRSGRNENRNGKCG